MQQLYYTSCRTGRSVGGNSGFHVRAMSPGLSSETVRAAIRYASYFLPTDTVLGAETTATAPIRLALLDTPDVGRIICHSVYLGKDPLTGRYGNFFSHILLDVPPKLQAGRVIGAWKNDFWKISDDDGETDLPDMTRWPQPPALDFRRMAAFASIEMNRKLLTFVLTALLNTTKDQRILLAAPAESVAICVDIATRLLPEGALGDLTFSTYEHELLGCHARLAATTWDNPAGRSLPTSAYTGSCVACNVFDGRRTEWPMSSAYAEVVPTILASPERFQQLLEFKTRCEQLQLQDSGLVDLVFRFEGKDRMNGLLAENAGLLLKYERVARHCIVRCQGGGDFLRRLAQWGLCDAVLHTSAVCFLRRLLDHEPNALTQIVGLDINTRRQIEGWLSPEGFAFTAEGDLESLSQMVEPATETGTVALPTSPRRRKHRRTPAWIYLVGVLFVLVLGGIAVISYFGILPK
ncbi:MAG: hypothetical protein WCJ35_07345 [Planctomycetota bacterium]